MKKTNSIIALGADIKSRYCVLSNGMITLSEDFGNLENLDNFTKYQRSVLGNDANFNIVAHVLHPAYFSSQIAENIKSKKKIAIQHHHAHIASMLYAKKVNKPVIGLAFDGTGYGSDGNIWGGEFMVADRKHFKRVAHFRYLPMPGGELAVKQPWRMGFSLLYQYFGEKVFEQKLDLLKLYPRKHYDVLIRMIKHKINSPHSSSVGRLFDAIASILGVCHEISFEAEAAIKLEQLASKSTDISHYLLDIEEQGETCLISHSKLVKRVLSDIKKGLPKKDIAKRFHNSIVICAVKLINNIGRGHNLKDVVLSGGVFTNRLLYDSLGQKINEMGYNLLADKDVPVHDLSICLGQAYIASYLK